MGTEQCAVVDVNSNGKGSSGLHVTAGEGAPVGVCTAAGICDDTPSCHIVAQIMGHKEEGAFSELPVLHMVAVDRTVQFVLSHSGSPRTAKTEIRPIK